MKRLVYILALGTLTVGCGADSFNESEVLKIEKEDDVKMAHSQNNIIEDSTENNRQKEEEKPVLQKITPPAAPFPGDPIDPIDPEPIPIDPEPYIIQAPQESVQEPEILQFAEEMPEFPGGMTALQKFMKDNLQYPKEAIDEGIQGKVYLGFIVMKDGSLQKIEIKRGIHPSLDKEALRLVKSMPNWSPGKQNGKPVNVRFTLPISFRLD